MKQCEGGGHTTEKIVKHLKQIFSCGKACATIPVALALGDDDWGIFFEWNVY